MTTAQLPPAQIAQNDSDALAEICMLYCEMEAVADSLQDSLNASADGSNAKRQRDRAYHLSMALQRLVQEVGRHAGAC